jgi:hypothetical protein
VRRPALLAVAILVAAAHLAHAHPAVDQGKHLYDDLEYKKAAKQFDKALKLELTKEDRTVALQYLGLCQATLNDLAGAAATFKLLLDLDPQFSLDRSSTPPKILDLFERVKSTMPKSQVPLPPPKTSELTLAHVAVPSSRPNQPVELKVTLTDPDHLASKVVVRYRKHGDTSYSELTVTGENGRLSSQIPGMFVVIPQIEYYIAAVDEQGKALTTAGTEDQPLVIAVREEQKLGTTPIYKRWWFWTIAGVVVVGAVTAIAAVVATRGGGDSSTGTANVTIMFSP